MCVDVAAVGTLSQHTCINIKFIIITVIIIRLVFPQYTKNHRKIKPSMSMWLFLFWTQTFGPSKWCATTKKTFQPARISAKKKHIVNDDWKHLVLCDKMREFSANSKRKKEWMICSFRPLLDMHVRAGICGVSHYIGWGVALPLFVSAKRKLIFGSTWDVILLYMLHEEEAIAIEH